MQIATAWVKLAPIRAGEDHLGTQAPCVSIYTTHLPGITSQTARARYYSFYPWLLREFHVRRPEATTAELVTYVRRAEVLFALIGIRHGRRLDEGEALHGAGLVGRDALVPAIADASQRNIALSTYAGVESSDTRYFQHTLGALGQYYFGPLREIGLLGGSVRTKDIVYTEERGQPLAELFGAKVNAQAFFDMLDGDDLSLSDLDDLHSFCPCGLLDNEPERLSLKDLLLDPHGKLGEEAEARRATLTLLLDLASRRGDEGFTFEGEFRAASYTGALADGTPWTLPEKLHTSRRAWAAYTRNELLSIAFQGVFWTALTAALNSGRTRFVDAAAFAEFVVEELGGAAFAATPREKFKVFLSRAGATLPPINDWTNEAHEIQGGWSVSNSARAHDPKAALRYSVAVLAALCVRSVDEVDPYADTHIEPSYLERYPINLRSFLHKVRDEWAGLSFNAVLSRWVLWAVRTHWRVAFQKLTDKSPRDTFKIRPLDGLLLVTDAPLPAFTGPRIHRAVGLLRDLGLLEYDESDRPSLTEEGASTLEVLRG